MRRPYQITGIVLVLFSAFIAREALRMRYYTPLGPGAGFLPLWLAILLGLIGAAIFLQATFQKGAAEAGEPFLPSRAGLLRMGAILLALAGTVALMDRLGFQLTMLGFLLLLLLTLGKQSLLVTALISLFGSFGVYYVFTHWLGVLLPTGVFGF